MLCEYGKSGARRIEVRCNAALTNLDGLSGITAVGALEVKYNDALTDECTQT